MSHDAQLAVSNARLMKTRVNGDLGPSRVSIRARVKHGLLRGRREFSNRFHTFVEESGSRYHGNNLDVPLVIE